MKVLAIALVLSFPTVTLCMPPTNPPACVVNYTVVTQDTLKNMKWGLFPKDVEWADKLQKRFPGVCYTSNIEQAHAVLLTTVIPDTYHGMRTVTDTSTTTSTTNSSESSTTTSSYEVPYSVDYGIYTLLVEQVKPDGTVITLHTFQQKGLYRQIYGIPLGGKGHHPAHAVIEDAVKWLSAGGLSDPSQSSNLIPAGSKP